jgi:hypothetical protein
MTERKLVPVTAALEAVEVKRRGDLIDLGILAKGLVVVVELTVEQAEEMRGVLKEAIDDAPA